MHRVLILNGSPNGERGNCGQWIGQLRHSLKNYAQVEVVTLARARFGPTLVKKIEKAAGIIFVTGTYWDSWGSPLQRLLEDMTGLEASSHLVGKPAAVFVLMHSVGGKSVLSRLQGVLSTMGFLIPPMSGMVYSLVSDIALKFKTVHKKDIWQIEDANLIIENFLKACDLKVDWQTWPVDKKNSRRKWLKFKKNTTRR